MSQPVLAFPPTFADETEARRLEALARLDVLDTPREEAFDCITRLIRHVFGVEVAIVSVMDAHRQWYKAYVGLGHDEVERKETFCKHVVLSGAPLVVEDAASDQRFCDHSHVVCEGGIRFYAGVPLRAQTGENIGTVCAIDYSPRAWSARDTAVLEDFAVLAADLLDLRQLIATDALTGLFARRAFTQEGERAVALAKRHDHALSLLAFDLDRFKAINDSFGHAAGDTVLQAVARVCREHLRQSDVIGRVGGEEFAVILPQTPLARAMEVAQKLRAAIAAAPIEIDGQVTGVTASFGVAGFDARRDDFSSLLAAADHAMYVSKAQGRNRCTARPVATAPRRRVLKAGLILFNNRSSSLDCTIRSLGEDGAGLDVSGTLGVPEQFTLRIRIDNLEKPCRVIAQTDRRIEVAFT